MSISVERLRTLLLVGVGLLALVVAVFVGYGKYMAHRILSNIPAKLGINITQETNSFTYSQTDGKRTIYTLHAAKSIKHTDGKYLLEDVGIVLYGKKQDRADRIYGKEFEYDPENGVIHAVGEVHIDLAAPAPATAAAKHDFAANGEAKGDAAHESHDPRMIHVTTSGLIYLQKLGVAATDQPLEFEFHGLTGHAKGADYNTDSGELLLHSAVDMSGQERGQPILLTAHSADLDRQSERVVLQHAKYVVTSPQGRRIVEAEKATAHLRSDGTADRVEAEGNVTLSNDEGATVTAPRGEMTLSAQNQPQTAMMTGGVKMVENDPLRQMVGEAAEGRVAFDKAGRPEHVVMTGAVHLHERQRVAETRVTGTTVATKKSSTKKTAAPVRRNDSTNASWSDRDLVASAVELVLAETEGKKSELRDAKASGAARLIVTGGGVNGHTGATHVPSSVIAGDVLTAHFSTHDGVSEIQALHGDGHTTVHRLNDLGVEDTSSGDVLDATFYDSGHRPAKKPAVRKASSDSSRQAQTIASAVQTGHVLMTHKPVAKAGEAASEERASGQRGVYDGDADTLTLTGAVQMTQPGGDLWADRMVMEQESGDVAVDGAVKASYRQAGAAETVHVLASRGDLKHDSGIAFFYGVPGTLARLWQGGSQVEAPVLRFDQKQHSLLAHGEGQGAPGAVHTTLVSAAPAKNATKSSKAPKKQDVARIASRELNYSDVARRADFTGGVDVNSADGTMRSQQATAFLQQPVAGNKASAATPAGQTGFMGGQVERVVANGGVMLNQPGRKATGEQIVYTASDQMYVLTGTAAVPPVVHDETQGTTTGCALRFHAGDNSVVVSNEGCVGRDQKVRSETQVKDSNR